MSDQFVEISSTSFSSDYPEQRKNVLAGEENKSWDDCGDDGDWWGFWKGGKRKVKVTLRSYSKRKCSGIQNRGKFSEEETNYGMLVVGKGIIEKLSQKKVFWGGNKLWDDFADTEVTVTLRVSLRSDPKRMRRGKCFRPRVWRKQIMGQPFLFHGPHAASNGNRQQLFSIFKKGERW